MWSWVCVGLLLALSLKDQLRLEGSRMWWHWDRWNKRREWDQAFRKACNTMLFEAFTVLDEANRKP